MFGNNSANSAETDKYKRYYAAVDFSPINNFTMALTGDFKSRSAIEDPNNPGLNFGKQYNTRLFISGLF